MENTIKKDDLGVPLFQGTSIYMRVSENGESASHHDCFNIKVSHGQGLMTWMMWDLQFHICALVRK